MKVHIGPYRSWIGPYQLAEALCFWAKRKDKHGFPERPEWVHQFGEILAHGSIEPKPKLGERRPFGGRDRKKTWLYRFLCWVHEKKKRKVVVKVDRSDVYDLYTTHSMILVPMLEKYLEENHGYPIGIDSEDVPEHLHGDDEMMWDYIVREMIWTFRNVEKDRCDFYTGDFDMISVREEGVYRIEHGPNHTAEFDEAAWKEFSARREKGLRLFAKYYFNLWI